MFSDVDSNEAVFEICCVVGGRLFQAAGQTSRSYANPPSINALSTKSITYVSANLLRLATGSCGETGQMHSGLLNRHTTRNNVPNLPRKYQQPVGVGVCACTLSNTLAIYAFPAFSHKKVKGFYVLVSFSSRRCSVMCPGPATCECHSAWSCKRPPTTRKTDN